MSARAAAAPPETFRVGLHSLDAVASVLVAASAALPGGCRGVLVGWDIYHTMLPADESELAVRLMLTEVADRLGRAAHHFVFSTEAQPTQPGVLPLLVGWSQPPVAFMPAIARLHEGAQAGLLPLLVSNGAYLANRRTETLTHVPGILRLSPDGDESYDCLGPVGYPRILISDEPTRGLSAHELLDASTRLINAAGFDRIPGAVGWTAPSTGGLHAHTL